MDESTAVKAQIFQEHDNIKALALVRALKNGNDTARVVNSDLKLIQFSSEQRFKTDTPLFHFGSASTVRTGGRAKPDWRGAPYS